nr:hypothetical protein B0A51_07283 [Rachicladosporium sp. CCFEE 5018]
MFWQCSEVFLKGYVTELELGAAWMREIPRIQPDMLWRSRTPWVWDRDDDDGLRSEWTMILEAYTSAKLTNPHKDKLIAIDGILSYLTAFRKTWYTCGMFWRDLPEALCWEQAEVAPSGRAPQYRAPSWSWASVDGTIFMPFLRVSAGSLRLTCVLNTMTWTQDDIPKTALLCVGRVLPLLPPHGDQVITNPKAYWIYFFYGQWVKVIFDDETEELTSAHRTLYYFPIVSLEDSNYRFKSPDGFSRMQRRNHNALLLVKNSDGTFSRVAKTTHDQNAVQCPLSPLLAAIQAQPAQLVILV